MDSHKPVMLSNSPAVSELPCLKSEYVSPNNGNLSSESGVLRKESVVENPNGFIGVLEVCIHQARDILNICIYHKQDVYAKLYLTSDPEITVSTKTINGGGQNPVFNENLQLNVRRLDSSIKCEIWMLSRVRNYLEDQLLGFALVPLSDVLIENGKMAGEFSLSSSDLFHSLAGFVQLTLTYTGASPEVLELPTLRTSWATNVAGNSGVPDAIPCELDKIEFPDPKVVNENEMMVSEYYAVPCANMDSQTSECLGTTVKDNCLSSGENVFLLESLATNSQDTIVVSKIDTPLSVSTNGSPSISVPTSSQSICDTPRASKSPNQDVSSVKEEVEKANKEAETGSPAVTVSTFVQPVISVHVEAEQKVVQQEIVDMYMKSMQQFTEALAKMKLPMDIEKGSAIENGPGNPGKSGSDEKPQPANGNGQSPRVFYGSRAFF
ncbi:unnamed protein product [Ilex paraguariensis]|uniref:C2 domain-containing protein n=1 Tax=Ilex paraguariensis TaxID=185542 RepID=A0ABC8QTZ4_9AQUA